MFTHNWFFRIDWREIARQIKQGRGVKYRHTRINDDYHQSALQEKTVLKSKAWLVAGIAIGALIALAIGIGIYVFLQMQNGVIV